MGPPGGRADPGVSVADAEIALACRCGAIRGALLDAGPREGTHLVCHCRDCRAAPRALGAPDPGEAGVAIFQTTPDRIRIDQGADRLGALRLSARGPLRWHCADCGTPLFNTGTRPGLPFVGVAVAALADPAPLGPVAARAFRRGPDGRARHQGLARIVGGFLRRTAGARLSGRWRRTPFFVMPEGRPVAEPRGLTEDERRAAYAF